MQHLLPGIQAQAEPGRPYADAHGGKTVQLQGVLGGVQPPEQPGGAHAQPHGRETVQLLHLLQRICTQEQPVRAHAHTPRGAQQPFEVNRRLVVLVESHCLKCEVLGDGATSLLFDCLYVALQ